MVVLKLVSHVRKRLVTNMKALFCLLMIYSLSGLAFYDSSNRGGPSGPEVKLVLGIDSTVETYQSPFRFPCTEISGHVFCETSNVQFESPACARTFFVDRIANKMELSCRLGLRKVVIATANGGLQYKAVEGSRYGHIPLQISNQVQLNRNGQKIEISFR